MNKEIFMLGLCSLVAVYSLGYVYQVGMYLSFEKRTNGGVCSYIDAGWNVHEVYMDKHQLGERSDGYGCPIYMTLKG